MLNNSFLLPSLHLSLSLGALVYKGAGNMCKAMCGVAAGACNGSINIHWSKGSDISDINAKFGAQVRYLDTLYYLLMRWNVCCNFFKFDFITYLSYILHLTSCYATHHL